MPSASVGLFSKHKGHSIVVLETGLSAGGASAVRVARVSSAKPKGNVHSVETKTWVANYWVLLDQVSTVRTSELVGRWTGPWGLKRDQMAIVRKELDKIAE